MMLKKLKFSIVLFYLLFSINLNSQNHTFIENEFNEFIVKAESYQDSSPDQYIKYINFAIGFADLQNNQDLLCIANISLGDYYYYQGNTSKSTSYYKNALEAAILSNKPNKQGDINMFLGINYDEAGLKQLAVDYYQNASQLYDQTGNEIGYGMAKHNLGIIYQSQRQFDKAIENYIQSLEIDQKHKNYNGIALSLYDISIMYYLINEVDSLQKYTNLFNKSIDKIDKSKQKYYLILNKYLDSHYLFLTNQHEKSLEIQFTIRAYYLAYKPGETIKIDADIASNLILLNRNKEALEYLENSLANCDTTNNYYTYKRVIKDLINVYYQLNNLEKSHYYANLYIDLMTNKYQTENKQLLIETEIRHETERKENEINILTKNNEIQELKMSRFKYWLFLGIFALVLVGIFLFLTHKQSTYRKETNKILSAKNQELAITNATKDKFFAIISHDIKNPLSAFNAVTSMLSQNLYTLKREELQEYIEELYNSSVSLQDLMNNLLNWARSQTNAISPQESVFNIEKLISTNINQLKSNITTKNIKIINNIDSQIEVFTDYNIIKTISLNIISNAIKFTSIGGEIYFNYTQDENIGKLSICDNGIGISSNDLKKLFKIEVNSTTIGSSSEKGTGLGLIICKDLITKLNGNIDVTSEVSKGSCFTIIFPINNKTA